MYSLNMSDSLPGKLSKQFTRKTVKPKTDYRSSKVLGDEILRITNLLIECEPDGKRFNRLILLLADLKMELTMIRYKEVRKEITNPLQHYACDIYEGLKTNKYSSLRNHKKDSEEYIRSIDEIDKMLSINRHIHPFSQGRDDWDGTSCDNPPPQLLLDKYKEETTEMLLYILNHTVSGDFHNMDTRIFDVRPVQDGLLYRYMPYG